MSISAESRPESLDKSAHKAVGQFPFDENSSTAELKKSIELIRSEAVADSKIRGSETVLGSLGLLSAGYLIVSSIIGDDNARKSEGVIAGAVFGSAISAYYLHRRKLTSDLSRAKQTYKRSVENQIRARREDDFMDHRNFRKQG